MNGFRISRRHVLRGITAAISLPLLDIMEGPKAAGYSRPTEANRVAYLYLPNGVADGAWGASQVDPQGHIVRLNKWMAPLEKFRQDILIPRNIWTPRGNGHGAGTATWLTGGGYDDRRIDAGGVSCDQIAADLVGNRTLLPSLELSLKGEGYFANSLARNTISWSQNGPVPRDIEPRVVFDRMFRIRDKKIKDRSVLDEVLEDARRMKRVGSASDQRKIEEYLHSIRAIERRMEFADRQGKRAVGKSGLKKTLVRPASGIPDDHGEYIRTMFDMMVLAFWSDATRVCTFMLDHGQSNRYFNFITGVQGTWHALSHWRDASGKTEDDDGVTSWASARQKREQYNRVTMWHSKQVAYFLGKLKSIREPNGQTLLDNSMIVYGSSLADGNEHGERNLPILLAGRGGGTIKSGRQIEFGNERSLSDLHLAILQRLGGNTKKFAESVTPMTEIGA